MANHVVTICDTCSIVVGSKGKHAQLVGLGYFFACEQFTIYSKTSGTWKCSRCKGANPGCGRGRGVRIRDGGRGSGRAITVEDN